MYIVRLSDIYEIIAPALSVEAQGYKHLYIHWDNGVKQYGSRIYENILHLYRVENNKSCFQRLASFPPVRVEQGGVATQWCIAPSVFQLAIVNDWIVISVGEFQGSARVFYGEIFRIKYDGSVRESIGLNSMEHRFHIYNDWIYYHIWDLQPFDGEGWYRFRINGSEVEFLGRDIYQIYLIHSSGWIFGRHRVGGQNNLSKWFIDDNEVITIFDVEELPGFEGYIIEFYYRNIKVVDNTISFCILIAGYPLDSNEWRIPWQIFYQTSHDMILNILY